MRFECCNPLTCDANGNLTAMQNAATPSSPITATYDAQNRLLGATRGTGSGADTMSVVYDQWNRPIYRTINGTTTTFVWDGWHLAAEYDAADTTGAFLRRYWHGAGVDEVLMMEDAAGPKYFHQDALGSTIALTDSTGALLESYTYDVFGTPQVFDAAGQPVSGTQHGNRFLYTGREWIAQLSLYDYRNRAYSAEIGRFMQTDPIRFAAGTCGADFLFARRALTLSGSCPSSDGTRRCRAWRAQTALRGTSGHSPGSEDAFCQTEPS